MSVRSLNKVMLIGNLTRDPELRYTPNGTAVISFSIATNRSWTTESGEKREEVEFHRIVAWSKLAELCSQLLTKGRKVFVEGRLQTRSWQGQDGAQRQSTEIVIDDMIILDSRRPDLQSTAGVVPPVYTANKPVAIPQSAVADVAVEKPEENTEEKAEDSKTARQEDNKTDKTESGEQKTEDSTKEIEKNKEPVAASTTSVPKEEINPDDIPF